MLRLAVFAVWEAVADVTVLPAVIRLAAVMPSDAVIRIAAAMPWADAVIAIRAASVAGRLTSAAASAT